MLQQIFYQLIVFVYVLIVRRIPNQIIFVFSLTLLISVQWLTASSNNNVGYNE